MQGFSLLISKEMLLEALDAMREHEQPGHELRMELCVHLGEDGMVSGTHMRIIELTPDALADLDASDAVKVAEEIIGLGRQG